MATTAVGGKALADCSLMGLSVTGNQIALSYDPFDATPVTQPIHVKLTGKDCEGAQVSVVAVAEPGYPLAGGTLNLSATPVPLRVGIVDPSGAAQLYASALSSPSGPASETRMSGASQSSEFEPLVVVIDPGQPVGAGVYVGRVRLLARVEGDDGGDSSVSEAVDVNISAVASLRLAVGSETKIELGEISPNEISDPVFFDAYANVGYRLVVSSEKAWKLTRTGLGGDGIAYEVLLSDSGSKISEGGKRSFGFDRPGLTGRRNHKIQVKISDFLSQPAGGYSDQITIEIRALA